MDTEFRTTEDLSPPQQLLALEMAEALWEAMEEARKERIMTCLAVENVIAAEVSEIASNPAAAGLRAEEVPSNEREKAAMQNLVLQRILEKRRAKGGFAAWQSFESMKDDLLSRYGSAVDEDLNEMSNRQRKGKEVIVLNSNSEADEASIDETPWREAYARNAMSDANLQRRLESGFFHRQENARGAGPSRRTHSPNQRAGNAMSEANFQKRLASGFFHRQANARGAGPSRQNNNPNNKTARSRKRKRDNEQLELIQRYMNYATGRTPIRPEHREPGPGPHLEPKYRRSKAANNSALQAPTQANMENEIACTGLRNVRAIYGPVAANVNLEAAEQPGPPWRLHRHQIQAVCLLLQPHVRGALLLYSMGAGKTLTAIACIDNLRRQFPGKYGRTVILAPASMLDTWESEMQRYAPIANVGEIHLGTHNSFDKMPQEHIKAFCRDAILVIDEVHNARNSGKQRSDRIAVGGRAAGKIVLLSGTPVVNQPSDIAPILDMIKPGCMPTSRKGFNTVFGNDGMAQRALMRAALSCAVLAYRSPADDLRYPRMTIRDTIVRMTPSQVMAQEAHGEPPQSYYDADLTGEPDPELMRFYDTARAICNSLVYRDGVLVSPPDVAGIELAAGVAAANHAGGNMQIVCPKLKLAVRHLVSRLGPSPDDDTWRRCKTVFFTHSVNMHGVGTLRMLLAAENIPFGEIIGTKSLKQRTDAIEAFNNDDLHVLILSEAGGEGLNLKGTRYFHMLEPQWNSTSENQAIARAARFKSHTHLPQNEQHVDVFRYLCVMPGASNNPELGRRAEFPRDSGDTFMRDICIRKDRLNGPFEQLVREVAAENEFRCFQTWDGS
ncbi:DNA excision repair protein ERCC-6 [Klebsormidium nitens]|uniref:DNA excision repair protein ERCC-6 n=1 Tax=Klebsormidium nitens TaxID=105231 RepID=A0A1Y1IM26_KLENI|nr:DNA excision repair protein ERCC-6 [Klebsormidium nitens]|eukprot:GAQ91172.1 DNA excision repair protein ERCC-6 [Klebsormidium nitens]